jgi:hypothetical protein
VIKLGFVLSVTLCAVGAFLIGKFSERKRVLLLIKRLVWDRDLDAKSLNAVNRLIDEI